MSKKKKAIIIGAVVVLLLVGAMLLLLLLPESGGTGDTESLASSEEVKLVSATASELVEMTVTNPSGGYTIEKKADGTWGVPEFEGLPETVAAFTDVRSVAATVAALKVVAEDPDNLAQYGLISPEVTVETDFGEGRGYKLLLGGSDPDGNYCYGKLEGENTVYAFSQTVKRYFTLSKYEFLESMVIAQYFNQSESTSPDLSYVKIERPDLNKPIILEPPTEASSLNSSDPIVMTSPVEGILNLDTYQDEFYTLFGLAADKIVSVRPTADELAEYGFDAPSSTLTMIYGADGVDKTVKVMTGKGLDADGKVIEDGKTPASYYVMAEGSELVYVVSASSLNWVDIQPKNLMSTLLLLPYIADVDAADITIDGKMHVLDISAWDVPVEDGSENMMKEYAFTLDDEAVDSTQAKRLYQLLLTSYIQDINETEVTKEPDLTITFRMLDGVQNTLDFYILEDMTTIIGLNGNQAYVGRAGYVEKLRKELNNLMEGKAVDVAW